MELLAILGVLVVIGVVCWMVIRLVFQVAKTGRDSRAWEKRFAKQEAAAEQERSNAELWEAVLANTPWLESPCPAICDDCKEDGGKAKMDAFRRDILYRDPVSKFIYQAMEVAYGNCILCGESVHELEDDQPVDQLHRGPDPGEV